MRARVVRVENSLHVEFDESMCIDTTIMPDFLNHIENIYNNHLTTCINNIAMQSIESQVTSLLQTCNHIGALYTGSQYMLFKDKPGMVCLFSSDDTKHKGLCENQFVFENTFKQQISKFQFVFGSCNG